MKDYQKRVDAWIQQYEIGYFSPAEIMLRLTEEVGELAREVNHSFGPKKKKETEDDGSIEGEIADILFTLTCLSNSLDIDMDDQFEKVMQKIEDRDSNRWQKKTNTK